MYSLPTLENADTSQPTPFWREVFSRISALSSTDQLPNTFTNRPQDFWVNAELAAAAAYAPDPEREPLFADYLYELKDCNLIRNEDAINKRLAQSVYHNINQHETNLRSLRGILIDYGEHEMVSLKFGNSKFAQALASKGIPFTLEVYQGGDHGNMIAERFITRGLPFFSRTLEYTEE